MISTFLGNPQPKTLIIVPKSIVQQWVDEIEKFAPHLNVITFEGPNRATTPSDFNGAQIVIAPYSVMTSRDKKKVTTTVLHEILWSRIVLDEGHEIRNPTSKVSVSVRQLQGRIKWVVSGTPVYNSVRDFVTLCDFVGIKKSLVLGFNKKIQDTFIQRRTKEDVANFNRRLELPPCDFENVELEMTEEEKDLYVEVFKESQDSIRIASRTVDATAGMKTMAMLEALLRCRQTMIHPQLYLSGIARKNPEEVPEEWDHGCRKTRYLIDSIEKHPEEKTLVFSLFIEEMDLYERILVEKGVAVFRIDGSVKKEDRIKALHSFKEISGTQAVFLIQIKAGGQGLNIQEATRVYITSPSWNPATELQAIARSHRTGQVNRVVVRKLIYNEISEDFPSIEQSIMTLQGHKSIVSAKVLNDTRIESQIPTKINQKGITARELRKIFHVR